MAYKHGVYIREVPTSILPPVRTASAIPLFVGTAPLHLSKTGLQDLSEKVHYPVLAYTYQEAVEAMGFSDDWDDYTLSECIYSHFALYAMAPVLMVNVLDPAVHKTAVAAKAFAVENKQAVLGKGVILDSVTVKASEEATEPAVAGVDYSLGWRSDESAVLNVLADGALAAASSVWAGFDIVDPSKVTSDDIIGGYSVLEDRYEGLELINQIFPKYRLIPGTFVVPKWSEDPEVAAIMYAKADNICGCFRCIALVDIPTGEDGADKYSEAPEWKNLNNYVYNQQVASWGRPKLGNRVYRFSTQLAGVIAKTDAKYDDIPYKSPSNENLQMNSLVNDAGKETLFSLQQANFLNENGIITALNWIGGWRSWGNRTAVYPASTDPKDAFIPIRRMFNWFGNELILTWFQKVDAPINKRLIETVVDSLNIRLNALAAIGALVGENNRVEFMADENPVIDLMDGIVRFHVFMTPPSPARQIDFILEYDVDNLTSLWES